MELGIGMFGDLTYHKSEDRYQPAGERMQQIIAQVQLADKLGIDLFAMGEHHRKDYAVPAPEIILAALASTTEHIKLASGVSVLSSADPVKLYQDFSMIDLISNERAEIFAGRGSFIESFPLFGYDLEHYNDLFEEKLDLLNQLNETEKINWEGYFRAPIKNQIVYPRPNRKLPIWIAVGGTPASVDRAARYGFPIIFAIIGGMPKNFIPLVQYYKDQYIKYGHNPTEMEIGVHAHTFVTESEDELFGKYFPLYKDQMDRIGKDRGWAPYTQQQFEGGISEDGALFMGNPETIADKIIKTIDLFGLTRFVAHLDVGAPTHKQMMDSIQLYGTEVIPKVRKRFCA